MKNKLVQVVTSDGLCIHGYYSPSSDKKYVVLNIHGLEGNFYENNFVHVLAKELEDSNIGFLTVNTRGNGKDTEFNTVNGDYRRIGAKYELLEEAHLDISAWLNFLISEGYENIILQGHSLGTMKVVRYLFEGEYKDKVNKLILLCPLDKKGLVKASGREDLEKLLSMATDKVNEGKGKEIITKEFDDKELSFNTFISYYKQDGLGRVFEFSSPNYDFPILKQIPIPTKIIVGSKDEYFYVTDKDHPEKAMDILLKNIPNSEGIIIKNAVHSFKPYGEEMAKEVSKFVLDKTKK